eukprot:s799_g1.t1
MWRGPVWLIRATALVSWGAAASVAAKDEECAKELGVLRDQLSSTSRRPCPLAFFASTRGGGLSSGEGAASGAHLVLQWCRLDSSKRLDGVPVTNVFFVGANVFSSEQASLMKVSVSDSLMVGARLAEHLKLRVLVDVVDCAILTGKVLGKGRQLLSLRLTTQRR